MDSHLSSPYVTIWLKPPIRGRRAVLTLKLGVAPDGVYIGQPCHHTCGKLLPHLFTLPGSDFPILLPLAFFDYRWIPVMLGEINQETRGNSGICQSLKHRLHADSCSGLYQNFSRVAHHSEVCFVFGFFRSSRGFNVDWFPYGAGMRMNLNL